MRRRSGTLLILTVIVIALLSYIAVFGLDLGDYVVKPLSTGIKQGLDLKGGIYVVEEIQDENVTDEMVESTIRLIQERIDKFGVVDPVVVREGDRRIRIEIPGMYDQQEALEYIGKTGKLRFVGPEDDEILTGSDVKDAYVVFDEYNKPVISLDLNDSGKQKFSEATEKYIGKNISIYLDEDLLISPTVQDKITEGKAVITNMEDTETAQRVAALIKSGALPVTLKPENVRTIGPSLGADALEKCILAGIVGIALVIIFMIVYYKLPGLMADIALIVYILLTFYIYVLFKVTISLAGIAGLLLSIGMAVDANVIIFERIKEELKTGKTLKAAIGAGFHRALSAIIDGNVTTVIAGIILAVLGSGPVKGFAVTLIIGTCLSMFTAIFITKFLLNLSINIKLFKNVKLYGA